MLPYSYVHNPHIFHVVRAGADLSLALTRDTLTAPSENEVARSARARYDLAALTGRLDGAAACRARHGTCQLDRQQMMQMLRSVDPQ